MQRKLFLFILLLTSWVVASAQCDYTLEMNDSYGDGWNGNTMNVIVNGTTVLNSVTLSAGSQGTLNFSVNTGDNITTNWNGGGSWGSETSYRILDGNGTQVGNGAQSSITTAIVASCPACSTPSSPTASAVTATSANIGATCTSCSGTYIVEYSTTSGFTPGTGATAGAGTIVTGATLPVALSGLSAGTTYYYVIRQDCSGSSNGFSANTAEASFTTMPGCGGNFYDSGGSAGNYANSETNTTWTICPNNAGDLVSVNFTSFNTEAGWDGLMVYNGNSTSSPLITSGSTYGRTTCPNGAWTGTTTYALTGANATVQSTDATGCLTFVFSSDGSGTRAGWEATVTCAPPPACPVPTSPTASTITATSANIGATCASCTGSYIVEYSTTSGFTQGTGSAAGSASSTVVTGASLPIALSGLSASTTYYYIVRQDCSGSSNGFSANTAEASFTTMPGCGDNFYDSGGAGGTYNNDENETWTICPNNAGDLVSVNFTSFLVEGAGANNCYDWLHIYDGNSTSATRITPTSLGLGTGTSGFCWQAAGDGTADLTGQTITSTDATGCLTFNFTSDGSGTYTGWAATITCTPPPACPAPTSPTASAVTATSANIGATCASCTGSYIVEYSTTSGFTQGTGATAGSASSTVVTGASLPVALSGLSASTTYYYVVRQDCSVAGDGFSANTTESSFTTLPGCGSNFYDSGGGAASYSNYEDQTWTICPNNAGDVVSINFTSFLVEGRGANNCWDWLHIYDGNSTSATRITPASLGLGTGTSGFCWEAAGDGTADLTGQTITSTDATGCITFNFTSDGSGTYTGWAAAITCITPPPIFNNLPATASNQVAFNHLISNVKLPVFSVEHSAAFTAIDIELNTRADFTGTAYTSNITGLPSASAQDVATTATLPAGTYFARAKIGSSNWSNQEWVYTYEPSITDANTEGGWHYTASSQFNNGTLVNTDYGNYISIEDNGTVATERDDYMQINEGTFNLTATNADGVKESGTWYNTQTYMTIGWQDDCNGDAAIYNGLPFNNVPIPQGATINSATMSLVASGSCACETQSAAQYLKIRAHDIDNAPDPDNTINGLTRTTAGIDWDITSTWTNGTRYNAPDISSVVQEIVNRTGWAANNQIDVLIDWDAASPAGSGNNRCVNQANNGATTAPELTGTFTNFSNEIRFPNAVLAYYGNLGGGAGATSWNEIVVNHNTQGCGSCEVEYEVRNAADNSLIATLTSTPNFNGTETASLSNNTAAEVYVVVKLQRNNSPQVFDITLRTNNAKILPVEMVSFTATAQDQSILLNWTTATEINNEGFEVQRSTNGKDFEKIAWVKGNGNTNNLSKYQLNDTKARANQLYYYRLKQIDFDGKYEYSTIVSAQWNQIGKLVVGKIYPNPTDGEVYIDISSATQGDVIEYTITNFVGKTLKQAAIKLQEGSNQTMINCQDLEKGTYLIQLKINGISYQEKLVIK